MKKSSGRLWTKPRTLIFEEGFHNKHQCRIKAKDSGYFSVRLPRGYDYLNQIHYFHGADYVKNLPENYVEIRIDTAERIYYIGDIMMTWDIVDKDESSIAKTGGGLVGALIAQGIDNRKQPDPMPMAVTVEPATIAHFAEKYDVDSSLIIVAPIKPRK
jgi:hypothetical protein